jgi:hypothetical protein
MYYDAYACTGEEELAFVDFPSLAALARKYTAEGASSKHRRRGLESFRIRKAVKTQGSGFSWIQGAVEVG